MSEDKQLYDIPPPSTGLDPNSRSAKLFVALKSKKAIKWLFLFVVIVAAAAFSFIYFHPKKATDPNCQQYIDSVTASMAQKDYKTVVDLANFYINKNCSNQARSSLSVQKGTALMFQKRYDEAADAFKQSGDFNEGKLSVAAAQGLANVNYIKGNKQEAVKYYKFVIEGLRDNQNIDDDAYIPQYETIIKNLGGKP